jgi:hypothetical protein
MCKAIQPDDIEVGMFITVLNGEMLYDKDPMGIENARYNGEVLKVIAVDLPYIVLQFYSFGSKMVNHFDVRAVSFATISTDYIKARVPLYAPEIVEEVKKTDYILEQELENK